MNFTVITRALSKIGRAVKKASPEIAIVGGTIGLIAAGVIACKETPKAIVAIEEHKKKLDVVKKAGEEGKLSTGEAYTEDDLKHDKALLIVQDGAKVAKAYAPAVILAIISAACIFAGGKILRNRLTTAVTAYGLLEQRFAKYRNDVIDRFGDDIDKELRYKMKDVLVEEKKEDGTTEVKQIKECKYDGYSQYARLFDELNPHWVKDGARNLVFLENQQLWANDKLKIEGILFLNDVYKMLGMDRTPEGQLVGWVYDPSNPRIDNYVDFGITEILKDKSLYNAIMNNAERSFMLDFNCDGRVIDKIRKYEKV